ncbi:MAG: hypothetical protein NT007_08075 [Candidatus Kapabacteria bacterium]|nr:hypothetical protein [Candidatus Kapabacteria bacterium]
MGKEKIRLEELVRDQNRRVDDWMETAEQFFNFAEKAASVFRDKNTSLKLKGNILNYLGSNLSLFDKKLSISVEKPFFKVQEIGQWVSKEKIRFEPLKIREYYTKKEGVNPQISTLLPRLELVRTLLLAISDRIYLS